MKFFKSTKGMSLVEIVIALAILGGVSVGMMGFFTNSFKFQAKNESTVSAQKLADEVFEKLKNNAGTVELDDKNINITNIVKGNADEGKYNGYATEIKHNNSTGNDALMIYDVTVTVRINDDIKGTVNGSIRIQDVQYNPTDEANKKTITYYIKAPATDENKLGEPQTTYGNKVTLRAAPSNSGYDFVNWLNPETNKEYIASETIEINGDISLIGTWTQAVSEDEVIISITYNPNGGSDGPGTQNYIFAKAESYEIPVSDATPNPTKGGHKFLGWSTKDNPTSAVGKITVTKDTTVYAVWEKNNNSNGGGTECICDLCIDQGQAATCEATEWCDNCSRCNTCATICSACGNCGACCECYNYSGTECICDLCIDQGQAATCEATEWCDNCSRCNTCATICSACGNCGACCECYNYSGTECICDLCIDQGQAATCEATEWCDNCSRCNTCATICSACGNCGACCECYNNEPVTCACNGCTNSPATGWGGYCEPCGSSGFATSDGFCTNGDCIEHCDGEGCESWWNGYSYDDCACTSCESYVGDEGGSCGDCIGLEVCDGCGNCSNCGCECETTENETTESGTTSSSSSGGGGFMNGISNNTVNQLN